MARMKKAFHDNVEKHIKNNTKIIKQFTTILNSSFKELEELNYNI